MNAFQYNIARAAHDGYWEKRGESRSFDDLEPDKQRMWLAAAEAVLEKLMSGAQYGLI